MRMFGKRFCFIAHNKEVGGDTVRQFSLNALFLIPMTNIASGNKCLGLLLLLFIYTASKLIIKFSDYSTENMISLLIYTTLEHLVHLIEI